MLKGSQPLDPKAYKKLGLNNNDEHEKMTDHNMSVNCSTICWTVAGNAKSA